MNSKIVTFTIVAFVNVVGLSLVLGHGMLMDPIGRSSRWRQDSSAPANYDDSGVNCGSFGTQYGGNRGKCGLCGDNYATPQPRPHEIGGKYGQGTIVKDYKKNSWIWVGAMLTANHLGYWKVEICNLDKYKKESEECFGENGQLMLDVGDTKFMVGPQSGWRNSSAMIPRDLVCKHCVLRWSYVAGNNWGHCSDGTGKLGCGNQETFVSCADIRVL